MTTTIKMINTPPPATRTAAPSSAPAAHNAQQRARGNQKRSFAELAEEYWAKRKAKGSAA